MELLTLLLFTIIGAIISVSILPLIEWYRARNRRFLFCEWFSAFQAPYYEDSAWHRQRLNIRYSITGILIEDMNEAGKLKWFASTKLIKNSFLVGTWRSRRKGSRSHGFISLQIAPNGEYMWGHIHGEPQSNMGARYGVILLARNEKGLEVAWNAINSGCKRFAKLEETVEYT